MLKSHIALLSILAATGLNAQAEESKAAHPSLRFLLTAGLNLGGDKLASVRYTDGSKSDVRAGQGFALGAGVLWKAADAPVSVKATVAYQSSGAFANNGSINFQRVPLELLAYYHLNEQWKLGGGLRKALNPSYSQDIDGSSGNYDQDFKSKPGVVLEAAYQYSDKGSVNIRLVHEKYELDLPPAYKRYFPTYNGTHVGVYGDYLF